ncbi:MAG: alkaline phosphatase family protein [Firmicutes bacterium HGW-Firmicutes-1]|jgi:predicted AlkP superfamily pyrophosphatase or phosphodiesterase|nr:MAG: alkaline phosphatase family protein [Firmicutes bacterium HGW-Firmicutes-1]
MSKNHSNQHLIIISLDALNMQDFEVIKTLPNFKSFLEEGSYVKEVRSVYPTVTYTCHTSIITGVYPGKHGIYANEKIQPERYKAQDWYWFEKDIKVPTLFDYTNKAGLISANVLWPVMAAAPITYNCPEIWSETGESYVSLYLKFASKNTLPIIAMNASKSKGKKQPFLDNFVEGVATQMILKKKPHLLCMHFIELDHERHVQGLHAPSIKTILERLDGRIGNIIEATKKAGTYENTTFILLGDHGCSEFNDVVYLNTYFEKEGFLSTDKNKDITSWNAYANSCGGSVQIHINKQCDEITRANISESIDKLAVMPNTFVKKLYSKKEVLEKHQLLGDFDFMIEPRDGFVFRNDIADTMIKNRTTIDNCFKSDHGQDPNHKDLKTLLFAKGNRIKRGVCLDSACIIDEGPTFARILGLKMENVDGRVLEEFIN